MSKDEHLPPHGAITKDQVDQGKPVTQGDLDHIVSIVRQIMDQVATHYDNKIGFLENRIEDYEKVLAVITTAFGETASITDAIFDWAMTNMSEEEQKLFTQKIEALRKELFETLHNGLDDGDTDIFTAVANMAE